MKYSNTSLCLAVICVLLFNRHCAEARRNARYTRVCEPDAVADMRFICQDDSFTFPFGLLKASLVMRSNAPMEHLYPFEHRFHTCCKRGCQHIGFRKMCLFHKFHETCSRIRDRSATRHQLRYARCLVTKTELTLARLGYPTRRYRGKRSVKYTPRKLVVV